MKNNYLHFKLSLFLVFSIFTTLIAQRPTTKVEEKVLLKVIIKDEDNQFVEGANVTILSLTKSLISDDKGSVLFELPKGDYDVRISFVGFYTTTKRIELQTAMRFNVQLIKEVRELNQVEISSENLDKNVQSTQQGVNRMTIATVKRLPTLLGEVDIIRSVQTLPGVTTVGEGAGGFNVRGGNTDQNLVLMDDIPIFNTSHLMGFFSIFNPDAVRDMTLYRGGIPPQYGGRTASVLDIKLKEPDWDSLRIFAGFSLMSTRVGVEIPIIKQKMSLLLAGRISYANAFLSILENKTIAKTRTNFNDLTGRFKWQINDKNFLYITSYNSYDDFKVAGDSLSGLEINATSTLFKWGTQAASARWYHIWRDGLYSNTSLIYSKYAPTMEIPDTSFAGVLASAIEHRQFKSDFKWVKNAKHTFDFGVSIINYRLQAGSLKPTHPSSNLNPIILPDESAFEAAAYWSDEFKINNRFTLSLGLRYSAFALMGPSRVLKYEEGVARETFSIIDSTLYNKSDIVKLYHNAEPRLSLKMNVGTEGSIKFSYQRLSQYIHQISNTTSALPTARWKMSDTYIKPHIADQVSVGYFKNFANNTIEFSGEVYFKRTQGFPDYRSGQNLLLKDDLETALLQGTGQSYGLELYAKKKVGRYTGWATYTFSRSLLLINSPYREDRNFSGKWYPVNFDRPHSMNLIVNYYLNRIVNFTANFTYSSGRPTSLASDRYFFDGKFIPHFPNRNLDRIPDYHRLDLSINIEDSPNRTKRTVSQWNISIYNIYNRRNPYSVFFKTSNNFVSQGLNAAFAYRFSVLGSFIPSITWNLKW